MNQDIKYRVATTKDYNSILEFIRQHFFPEEPLTNAFQPSGQDSYQEETCMSNLGEGEACVIAVYGEQIVGLFLAGPKYPNEAEEILKDARKIPNTKWARLLQLLADLESSSNVFKKYNDIDKAIHGHVLSVDKNFRGHGIGLKLLEKSIERAAELKYPLYCIDCTSIFSAKLCERLKMDCVNVYSLADYRARNNDAEVFSPQAEGVVIRSYAKRLL